mmetsp:Transcript_37094/g.84386  ORF Transcript_37094/g.84386 Transcript_37094/m.84386 type:complete len:367 (+) Transcript_37094:3-1103(+)
MTHGGGSGRRSALDRLMRPTESQQQRGNSEADAVRMAFLPTSFVQLRLLPNNLSKRKVREKGRTLADEDSSMSLRQESSIGAVKKQLMTVAGTVTPRRHAISAKLFSSFTYQPSEYGLERSTRTEARQEHLSRIVGAAAIKTGMPTIPAKQGTFTHFRYEIDPYEAREEAQRQARYDDEVAIKQQNFRPGGKFVAKDEVRKKQASCHELVARIIATLQADWPEAYARCYVDKRGLIVCMFAGDPNDDPAWLSELIEYMHNLIKTHPVSSEFCLRKMSARWGNNANGYIEFVCQPPWVNLSPYEPYFRSHLEEVAKGKVKTIGLIPKHTAVPPSRRVANPPTSPDGTRIFSYFKSERPISVGNPDRL